MGSLEMTCHGLECGGGRGSSAVSNNSKDECICFPKATEVSCSSQPSYSAADSTSSNQGRDSNSEIDQVLQSRRVSSVVATDCVVDIENGVDEVRISLGTMERECRICMMSLDSESGIAIELGCSCKDELAAAHQYCAETWFRSKGNNICEICKSIAQNVVVPNNNESSQQVNAVSTNAVPVLVYEVNRLNTVSTNAGPAQVIDINFTSSPNAISVSVSDVNPVSTNAVSVSVSSTSSSRGCSILEMIIGVLVFIVLTWFLGPVFNGAGN